MEEPPDPPPIPEQKPIQKDQPSERAPRDNIENTQPPIIEEAVSRNESATSPEPPPLPPEIVAQIAYDESRLKRALENPDIQKGMASLARTLLNAGVVAADFVPIVGDAVSWTADAMKLISPITRALWNVNLDYLSPTVGKTLAISTEALEIPGAGVPPTHIIEAILQLKREDFGRMKKALEALKNILAKEKADYQKNKKQIDEAVNLFKDKQ